MEDRLAKHIETLLCREQCIVVRGLGGFVLELQSAYWDKESLLAFPPSVALHFNERLNYNDGFLEEHYAKVYGISLRRARIMIDEDVRKLHSQLVKDKTYALKGLGTLQLSDSGVMSFEPKLSETFASISYGLTPVAIPNKISTSKAIASGKVENNSDYFTLRLSKRSVRWTSAAAVLLAVLFPWSNSKNHPRTSYQAGLAPQSEVIERLWDKETKKQAITESLPSSLILDELAPLNEEEANKPSAQEEVQEQKTSPFIVAEKGRYYVIIASEPSKEGILRDYKHAQDNDLDFGQLVILSSKKMLRLSTQSFDNTHEAQLLVRKLKQGNCPAWVYKAK